jgi:Protein of unknown function, DUF481
VHVTQFGVVELEYGMDRFRGLKILVYAGLSRRPKDGCDMRIRLVAAYLSFGLLIVSPVFARPAKDLITMKNGDRMTCEIKGLDHGVLSVSLDYVDGTLSVQWSKVARLESTQQFIVATQDGSVHSGVLHTTEDASDQPMHLRVGEEREATVLDAAQIVEIDQTSARFLRRFNGTINFGISYSKGNEATQYNFGASTNYLRERWAAQAAFNSNLSANTGSATSTRQQLNLGGYHLSRWDNYFYDGLVGFLQSSVQEISLQTSVGGGIGRFLRNTGRTTLTVVGGLAWQNTNYRQSSLAPSENATTALLAAECKIFRFKKTNFDISAELFPVLSEPGRVRFNTNASYYLKLFRDLSWNVSFYGNWDNRPPHNFAGSDYGTSSGLKWTFGNQYGETALF